MQSREPISQENHVVSAHNYVRNFGFVPRFWSLLMTRIVYEYAHLPTLFVFPLWLPERTFSLSPFRLTDSTHSSSFLLLTSSCQPPRKRILSATILFLVLLFQIDLLQPRKQQKFRHTTERKKQTTWRKKQTTNNGEDTFLLTYIIKIL